MNTTFGGIMFYLAFKLTAKNFGKQVLANYLIMAGFGFMLFFSASQANVMTTVYPPFGFATISTYGLGSYLILLGLYLSALSVSQDEQVRNMIRRSTLSESKFLHSIETSASVQRNNEILNSVLSKAKRHQQSIKKDVGIGTSLTDEDIMNYVKKIKETEVKESEEERDKV